MASGDTSAGITGTEELDLLIAQVRNLPTFVSQALPQAAHDIQVELGQTIEAGTNPYGEPWKPKQRGSGRPLADAARAVYVAAMSFKILIRVTGIEASHHRGWVRGGVVREVIPVPGRPLPDAITNVIFKSLTDHFTLYMTRP